MVWCCAVCVCRRKVNSPTAYDAVGAVCNLQALYVSTGQDYFQFSYWPRPSNPPRAQMLAHRPSSAFPLASPASHLSLAASLPGWPAGVENQPLMGLWGLGGGGRRRLWGG